MKAGDRYVGDGSGLSLVITKITKANVEVVVERKVVNNRTGEVGIEKRERVIPLSMMDFVLAGYSKEKDDQS